MPIATKNGSAIVKDGKLAESCGCCGGWYCCPNEACASDFISSIRVTIAPSSPETLAKGVAYNGWREFRPDKKWWWSQIFWSPHSALSGTHTLSRVGNTDFWEITLPATHCGLQPKIEMKIIEPPAATWRLKVYVPQYSRGEYTSDGRQLSKGDIECVASSEDIVNSFLLVNTVDWFYYKKKCFPFTPAGGVTLVDGDVGYGRGSVYFPGGWLASPFVLTPRDTFVPGVPPPGEPNYQSGSSTGSREVSISVVIE